MEITELASKVLLSSSLSDKLISPALLTDNHPIRNTSQELPKWPARPQSLRLDIKTKSVSFPKTSDLHKPTSRGIALHFFANHELLAIELMAMCLLRFPKAPKKFRLGVAQVLVEEQQHLSMYIERMHELGVELGDVPVNGHFWRLLSGMQTPMQYVVGMSMTFEQANLDHAYLWAQNLKKVEDSKSSKLMMQIFEDEIGHVKHGVHWFHQWKESGNDDFEQYKLWLPQGLDPIRAKGQNYHEESRVRAGLSEEYIGNLRRYRNSKGRRPKLFLFNPMVEEECTSSPQKMKTIPIVEDLSITMGLLAAKDDLVLCNQNISSEFIDHIQEAGLNVPKVVKNWNEAQKSEADEVIPWGWSSKTRKDAENLDLRVPCPTHDERKLLSKTLIVQSRLRWAQKQLISSSLVGHVIYKLPDLSTYPYPYVIKAAYSASGRHRRIILSTPTNEDELWIEKVLKQHGAAIIEPWLDKVVDLSVVIDGDKTRLFRFINHKNAAYQAHILAPALTGLDSVLSQPIRRFPGGPKGLLQQITEELSYISTEHQYNGPMAVDMILFRDIHGNIKLHPLVEINARYTMGHIAAKLQKRLSTGASGLWIHIRSKDINISLKEMASKLKHQYPLETCKKQQIQRGVIFTNDPQSAQSVLSVAFIDASLSEILKIKLDDQHTVAALTGDLNLRTTTL